jgi:myo-inositol-1(or 4)-monophosphatase
MHPFLNIAFEALKDARKLIIHSMENMENVNIKEKARNDFVTEVDQKVEHIIIEAIRASYPDHAILGEEHGQIGKHEYTWIIDPIDGTTNFIHGHPYFCTSIGIKYKNRIEHGLIYDHLRHELFTASRGGGAYLDNKRIRVSKRLSPEGSVFESGIAQNKASHLMPLFRKILDNLYPHAAAIRNSGAAALELAYIASGRMDAIFKFGLSIWDFAAGILLVKEAGGIVTDELGAENYFDSGNVIAANPKLIKELLKIIKQNL